MEKNQISIRAFLNGDRAGRLAAIGFFGNLDAEWGQMDGTLQITDCYKQVVIDFSVETREDVEEALAKFDRILRVVALAKEQYMTLVTENIDACLKTQEKRKKEES